MMDGHDARWPLLGLHPRLESVGCLRASAARALEEELRYVAARVELAIAVSWDRGLLSAAAPGELPFRGEVRARLGQRRGEAREEVQRCEAQLRALDARRLRASQGRDPVLRGEAVMAPPLWTLAWEFDLSDFMADLLLLVAAPLLWGELARLYGVLANDPGRALCDELLLCQLFGLPLGEREQVAHALHEGSPLLRHGLLQVGPGRSPFAAVGVEPLVLQRLRGERFVGGGEGGAVRLRLPEQAPEELVLAEGVLARLLAVVQAPPAGGPLRLVLRGRTGSGRRALMAALAQQAGRALCVIDVEALQRAADPLGERLRRVLQRAVLRGQLPLLEQLGGLAEAARGEVRQVLADHPGPLVLRVGLDEVPKLEPGYAQVDLAMLSERERGRACAQALRRHGYPEERVEGDAAWLAARHMVGPGIFERVAGQVVRGGDAAREALEEGLRQHRAGRMSATAQRVTRLPRWESVVLPAEVEDAVLELIGRIRYRRQVFEDWGMDRVVTSARGVTALFQGSPGTGKTLVAGLIARELGYELHRIDLSRVMSKWIGETEQNLAQVFEAAEEGQVILLFDEADSLFARRTEVRTSVDRYANAEVNYLLQRLDSFEGVAILTTNLSKSIDAAFKRRLSLRITFPFPDEAMREELWRVHLPQQMPLGDDLDLGDLARRYELSGGYIRNAVLRAAFLAAQEGQALRQEHLDRAVKLEYREVGKLFEGGVLE